jgi:thioredoxin-related protein
MKKIVFLLLLITIGHLNAQEINWMTMNEAIAAQQEKPKKIFMDVYTTWCGPCKLMDRNTFSNKDVINYLNDNYYAVKFNAEGTEEITIEDFTYTNPNYQEGRKGRNTTHFFADALNIRGYPSVVFFGLDGAKIEAITGYKTPSQLEIYLKMIDTDDYLELVTAEDWARYQKNFKGTFKE